MSLKNKIKNCAYFLLNSLSFFYIPQKASVLMYHSVGDSDVLFNVFINDLERHLSFIKNKKYNVIRLVDLIKKIKNKEKISPKTVVITFDDGYKDNCTNAFPLLKKYDIPATIFISTSHMGKEMPNSEGKSLSVMTWQEVKDMENFGLIDFAPHSHTHKSMDKMNINEFINEVNASEELLNQNLKRWVKIFSFPKGKFKIEQLEYLRVADYLGAVTVNEGLTGNRDNPFSLKRNFVFSEGGFSQFKGKLNASVEIINFFKKIFL